jgi:spermidine synthase
MENAPYYAHALRSLFTSVPEAFYPYHAFVLVGMLAVLCVPIGLSGALLPLVFHHLRGEMGGLGGVAGRLYAWNTLGSLLGALLGGYALLFFIDLHQVYAIALAALVVGAGVLSVLVLHARVLVAGLVTVAALGACLFLPGWDAIHLSSGLFRHREAYPQTFEGAEALYALRTSGVKMLFHDDDPTSTVAVTETRSLSILTNGKPDGNLRFDYPTMALAGLLPALLCDHPSRAFVIGWGTGVTVGELGRLDDVEEVVVAEISPAVLAAAPFFDEKNQYASRNPKVRTIRGDAYRALQRSEGQFDVIVSEPSNPWVMGVEMLFSEEFLRVARDRLSPGGIFAQWFHLYEVNEETVGIVLRTYQKVFGDMAIWFTRGADVVLLGFEDANPAFDIAALERRFERADFRAGFERAGVGSWIRLLAHEIVPLGAVGATDLPGRVHTLRHPILSDSGARAFYAGREAELPRMPSEPARRAAESRSLLRAELGGEEASEDVLEELAQQACRMERPIECTVLLARWKASAPDSRRMAENVRDLRVTNALGEQVGALPVSFIESLAELYRGHPPTAEESPGPLRNAIAASNLYVRFFQHAFPFDRAALEQAWSRCAAELRVVDACTAERRRFEQVLGPIYPKKASE